MADAEPNARQLAEATLSVRNDGGRPPFLPAVYEHKAFFIGRTPSRIARDADLLTRAVLAEYEQLEPDALTIGVDVYNVEAEAAGCKVLYYGGDDTSIPGLDPNGHAIGVGDDLSSRPAPNPMKDGRMPVFIDAARHVVHELGDRVWVRGALTGPFSLAAGLVGPERLFMAAIESPAFVHDLLAYAVRIAKEFARAYIEVGAGVVLFDSLASCDLLSPAMYRQFVLPATRSLIASIREMGGGDVPLIIGGNTTPIIDDLIASGANNLLCDFKPPWPLWLQKCAAVRRAVRRNLDPQLMQGGSPDAIYEAARAYIHDAQSYPGFLMGTAVVPFGTPTENLLAVRQACRDTKKQK